MMSNNINITDNLINNFFDVVNLAFKTKKGPFDLKDNVLFFALFFC